MSTDRVQNDNIWTKYLSKADKEDERLVDNWNKLLDVVLTFVRCYSSSLHYRFYIFGYRLDSSSVF